MSAQNTEGRPCPSCGQKAIIRGKAEYGGGFVCWKKMGGCGAKFDDQLEQRAPVTTPVTKPVNTTTPPATARTSPSPATKPDQLDDLARALMVITSPTFKRAFGAMISEAIEIALLQRAEARADVGPDLAGDDIPF